MEPAIIAAPPEDKFDGVTKDPPMDIRPEMKQDDPPEIEDPQTTSFLTLTPEQKVVLPPAEKDSRIITLESHDIDCATLEDPRTEIEAEQRISFFALIIP